MFGVKMNAPAIQKDNVDRVNMTSDAAPDDPSHMRGDQAFERCYFILGKKDNSVIIVVPGSLPQHEELSLHLKDQSIVFYGGEDCFANIDVLAEGVIKRLASHKQVGIIEAENGVPQFPAYITAVATIKPGTIS